MNEIMRASAKTTIATLPTNRTMGAMWLRVAESASTDAADGVLEFGIRGAKANLSIATTPNAMAAAAASIATACHLSTPQLG